MSGQLGCTNLIEHKIIVELEPTKQRAHRVSPLIQTKINEQVTNLLKGDIIEPSTSA